MIPRQPDSLDISIETALDPAEPSNVSRTHRGRSDLRSPITASTVLRALIGFYLLWNLLMVPMVMFRLLGIYQSGQLVRWGLSALIPGLLLLLAVGLLRGIRLDWVALVLFSVFGWGILVGIMRGNPFEYVLADTVATAIPIMAYIVSSQRWARGVDLRKIIPFFAYGLTLLYVGLVVLGYLLLFLLGADFWLSLGGVILLLPLAYFLRTRKHLWTLACITPIMLGSKVGVIISSLIVVLLHRLQKRESSLRVIALVMAAVLLIGNLGFYYASTLDRHEGVAFKPLEKLLFLYNPYYLVGQPIGFGSLAHVPENFGGGRAAEVIYSIREVRSLPVLPLLTGAGHGFAYDMWYYGQFEEDRRNVHLSPVSLLTRYGIPLTALLLISIGWVLVHLYYQLPALRAGPLEWTMFLFCVGALVFSLSAYSFFNVTLFWFFLGLLRSRGIMGRPDKLHFGGSQRLPVVLEAEARDA